MKYLTLLFCVWITQCFCKDFAPIKDKPIFITGVAGFIGHGLADKLLELGYDVYGCDILSDYYDLNLKRDRVKRLEAKGLHFYRLDVRNIKELTPLFLQLQFDDLVHLAAQPGIRHSLTHPQDYIDHNIDAFLQVLELCKKLKKTRLIYASSSSVYGDIQLFPQHEEMNVSSPNSLYAATKIADELFAKVYHHVYGLQSIGLRFFTVYGPWGRPDMAHFMFTQAIDSGKPVMLFDGGRLYRDFTYIDDIVNGIIGVIYSNLQFEIMNLGKGNPDKIGDLVTFIEQKLGKKAVVVEKPLNKTEVYKTYADISKAKGLIGYEPEVDLKTGVGLYIEWYKSYYNTR
jgi:UDP-glucuronate 4-epimerase